MICLFFQIALIFSKETNFSHERRRAQNDYYPPFTPVSFRFSSFLLIVSLFFNDVNVAFLVKGFDTSFFILVLTKERTKEIKWLFYLSVLCRRLAHDVIVWKHWPTSCLFSSFVHVFVWLPYTRLFETCLILLYFRESVNGDLFLLKHFLFCTKM